MSVPVVPERDRTEAISDILESIALEEAALAHLINAEAEKVQWSLGTLPDQIQAEPLDPTEVIAIQEEVVRVMRSAIKFQMLLQFKLEDALAADAAVVVPAP